jgi:hypothetical protein
MSSFSNSARISSLLLSSIPNMPIIVGTTGQCPSKPASEAHFGLAYLDTGILAIDPESVDWPESQFKTTQR